MFTFPANYAKILHREGSKLPLRRFMDIAIVCLEEIGDIALSMNEIAMSDWIPHIMEDSIDVLMISGDSPLGFARASINRPPEEAHGCRTCGLESSGDSTMILSLFESTLPILTA